MYRTEELLTVARMHLSDREHFIFPWIFYYGSEKAQFRFQKIFYDSENFIPKLKIFFDQEQLIPHPQKKFHNKKQLILP